MSVPLGHRAHGFQKEIEPASPWPLATMRTYKGSGSRSADDTQSIRPPPKSVSQILWNCCCFLAQAPAPTPRPPRQAAEAEQQRSLKLFVGTCIHAVAVTIWCRNMSENDIIITVSIIFRRNSNRTLQPMKPQRHHVYYLPSCITIIHQHDQQEHQHHHHQHQHHHNYPSCITIIITISINFGSSMSIMKIIIIIIVIMIIMQPHKAAYRGWIYEPRAHAQTRVPSADFEGAPARSRN